MNVSGVSDTELLQYVLGPACPPKGHIETLLETFGNFQEIVAADPARLRESKLPDEGVARLKMFEVAAVQMGRQRVLKRTVLSAWSDLIDYLTARIARDPVESFHVMFLDRKNNLIVDQEMSRGTVDHAPVYPREIIKRALELNASALILAHNHPSGDPTPSRADIDMTREIVEAARALRIAVHDHIVVGRGGHASFKALGLL